MIIITNFENYLNIIGNGISDEQAMKYYNMVTKPLFQELIQIAESRLSDIEQRVTETNRPVTTQSKFIIGEVPVNGLKSFNDTFEPIIDINSNVDYVEEKSNVIRFKNLKPNKNGNTKLFSYTYNVDYNEFISIVDKTISARITDEKNNMHDVELHFQINTSYKEAESKIKELITSNKICDKFYPVPICRRIVDVYVSGIDCSYVKSVVLSENLGKICVPIWNVTTNYNKTISRRTISPYSQNSKRNIYVGEIDIKDKTVIDCLAESEYIDKKFLHSDFVENKIRIYSDNKDSIKSLTLYYITDSLNRKINNVIDLSVLNEINLDEFSSNYLSEGIVTYIINDLAPITNYELESIECNNDEIVLELVKVENKFCYDYEMKQFVVEILRSYYPQYSFKVKE